MIILLFLHNVVNIVIMPITQNLRGVDPWYFDPKHSQSAKIIDMFDPEILGIEGPTQQTGLM